MNRWLLGFDVRTAKEQYVSRRWGRDVRAEYLLHHWCPVIAKLNPRN